MQDPPNGTLREPILATATLAEQVYDNLRQGILANDYPPGTSLREESLAAHFAVSRVPVREALRRLAADGLVTLTPRLGATVSSLSPKQFLDAYRVREALETLAIRLAVPNFTAEDMEALRHCNDQMRLHATNGDTTAFFAANAAFHDLIMIRADNDDLRSIYSTLMDRMRRYRWPSLDLRGGMERSVGEHDAILGAIVAGDQDEAARLLAAHIHVPQKILEDEGAFELTTR
ncbi:MAG: GntR family transcriptional regulator [Thermomicrobiales bacterium]